MPARMTYPIFLDTNIPIYAAGTPHRLREPSRRILRLAVDYSDRMLTSAEVLQELVHRYISIRRWDQGRGVLSRFARIMRGRVEPIYLQDVQEAAALADRYSGIDARDLLHLAVMQRVGCTRIATADTAFDRIDGIERLDPMRFDEWAPSITDSA